MPLLFSNHITIRLTAENYLFWRAQILPLLHNTNLLDYIDGSFPCPPQVVMAPSSDGVARQVINPAYGAWIQQDQAILSAI
jgi:hypothetical protein